jgi:hypothetical protein
MHGRIDFAMGLRIQAGMDVPQMGICRQRQHQDDKSGQSGGQ